MAQQRGDSDAAVGGTPTDVESTFEQSSLGGTTQTGNARLIVRDATQIEVIDTNNYYSATTVEGVLDEIGAVTLNPNMWGSILGTLSDQTDLQAALDLKATEADLTLAEADIATNTADITTEESARIAADALKVDLAGDTMDSGADLTFAGGGEVLGLPATPGATGAASKEYVDALPQPSSIINGNFDVWQRGTSKVGTVNTETLRAADRIHYAQSSTCRVTHAQGTDVPTYAQSGGKSNYNANISVTTADATIAAGDYSRFIYKVEGYDYARIAGGDATISFWVKAVKTGTYCVGFSNSGGDRSYVAEYTINTTETWEKKTITIPLTETGGTWDYTNGIGLRIDWTIAAGTTYQTTADAWQTGNYFATSNQVNGVDSTSNVFRLAQVKMERGDVATPFALNSYADEESKCQRYFQKSYNAGHAPGAITKEGSSTWRLYATTAHVAWQAQRTMMERMRATPTITWYSTGTGTANRVRNDSLGADYTVTATTEQNATTTGSPSFAAAGATVNNNVKAQWTADSEL